jgi:small subunit ribosomal protein S11
MIKVHILSSSNNTIVTVLSEEGFVSWWATPALLGYKKSKRGSSAEALGQFVGERLVKEGIYRVHVLIKGLGPGRIAVIRGIRKSNIKLIVEDFTSVPHNGCTLPKKRRL